jgi:hypothetical protein
MSEIPPLSVQVQVDASGVAGGVTKATQGIAKIGASAGKLQGSLGSLKTTIIGVLGGNLLTTGIMTFVNEINGAKNEVKALETETVRLNMALSNVGVTSAAAQESIVASADAFYQLGFQGSEVINALGTLVTATGDVEQSQKLLAMSADFARHKQIGIASAAQILQRATMGNARAFKQMGISLDENLPKNQAIAKAFDELNAKIGGSAIAYTETFSGRVAVLKEKMGNLFETIGMYVLPVLSAFIGYISENGTALLVYGGIVLAVATAVKTYGIVTAAVKSVQQAYAFWTYAQTASTSVLTFAVHGLNAAMRANPIGFFVTALMLLGAAFVWAWNKFDWFRKGIVTGIQMIVKGFGYLIGGIAKLMRAMSYIPGMGFLKGMADGVDKFAVSIGNFSESLDSLADKKVKLPGLSGFTMPGGTTGITAGNGVPGDTTGNKGGGSTSTVVQNIVVYASNTNDIERKMAKAAKQGVPIGKKP